MKMSPEVKELFEAFSQFQGEVKDVVRDTVSLKGKYAKLDQVVQMRELFSKFGLSFTQMVGDCSNECIEIENLVMHKSGQFFSKVMKMSIGDIPLNKEGKPTMSVVQHIGSAISYARRYGLLALAGLAQEDNDGALPENSTQKSNRPFSQVPPIPFQKKEVSTEMINQLKSLISAYKISEERVNEWKNHFKVSSLESLSKDQASAIIQKINEKMAAETMPQGQVS
jgi:hypothetical protein